MCSSVMEKGLKEAATTKIAKASPTYPECLAATPYKKRLTVDHFWQVILPALGDRTKQAVAIRSDLHQT